MTRADFGQKPSIHASKLGQLRPMPEIVTAWLSNGDLVRRRTRQHLSYFADLNLATQRKYKSNLLVRLIEATSPDDVLERSVLWLSFPFPIVGVSLFLKNIDGGGASNTLTQINQQGYRSDREDREMSYPR